MYETELMREILTDEMSMKMVQEVSPRYGNAYAMLWLFQTLGIEVGEVYNWCEEYRNQVVPQTATWSLPYWEMTYNIIPNPEWTTERRRLNIINKMRSRGPMNPTRLAQIISVAAGTEARIVENTGKNKFSIYLSGTPGNIDEKAIRKAIKPAKSPRLIYDINYETSVAGNVYIGGIIQCFKDITLTQY